jgi:hypothetical protein
VDGLRHNKVWFIRWYVLTQGQYSPADLATWPLTMVMDTYYELQFARMLE